MDELSTFIHCHDKSFIELIQATEVGVDWMPILYFLIIWAIDLIIPLTQTVMRIPNLVFICISFILILNLLYKAFGNNASLTGTVTVFTHSLLIPFILCEARPYALYLMLSCWVAYELQRAFTSNLEKKLHVRLLIANFLCPASHYFGGIYCALSLVASLLLNSSKDRKSKSVIYSSILGWAVFFLCCHETLSRQMEETITTISNEPSLYELFNIYGTQVYFPILFVTALACNNTRAFKKQKSLHNYFEKNSNFILLLSASWIAIPTILFVLGKITGSNYMQLRYYSPNLLAYGTFLAFLCSIIMKDKVPRKLMSLAYVSFCLILLTLNTRSLASSYKDESPENALAFLDKTDLKVATFSMRVAFHITHYHTNAVQFLVADQRYSSYMKKFSKHLNCIAIESIDNLIILPDNSTLKSESKFIYIHGPMGSPINLQQIDDFALRNGYEISKRKTPESSEASHAFYFEKITD